MAKKLQLYQMHVSELLAKPELIRIMVDVGAIWTHPLQGKYGFCHYKPSLVWNEYNFLTDGENWYFQRPHYQEGTPHNGMIAYACQIKLEATHKYTLPFTDDEPYSYDELTELITSEIEIIPNKHKECPQDIEKME